MNRLEMFNRNAAFASSRPDEILETIKIKKGFRVLEVGVGGGYYAQRFSSIVGDSGSYLGVDVNASFLEALKKRDLMNVRLLKIEGAALPVFDEKFDLIFCRNAYHHFNDPERYCMSFAMNLKPEGRVVIIDYNKRKLRMRFTGHFTDPAKIQKDMGIAGLDLTDDPGLFKTQFFHIYSLKI